MKQLVFFFSFFLLVLLNFSQIGFQRYLDFPGTGNQTTSVFMEEESGGGFVVCGNFIDNSTYRAWIGGIDVNGNKVWEKKLVLYSDSLNLIRPTCIRHLADNNFLVAGSFVSHLNPQSKKGLLFKVSPSGTILWVQTYGSGPNQKEFVDVCELNDGSIGLGGYQQVINGTNENAWVLRTDSLGNVLWQYVSATVLSCNALRIKGTADGNVAICGLEYDSTIWGGCFRKFDKLNGNVLLSLSGYNDYSIFSDFEELSTGYLFAGGVFDSISDVHSAFLLKINSNLQPDYQIKLCALSPVFGFSPVRLIRSGNLAYIAASHHDDLNLVDSLIICEVNISLGNLQGKTMIELSEESGVRSFGIHSDGGLYGACMDYSTVNPCGCRAFVFKINNFNSVGMSHINDEFNDLIIYPVPFDTEINIFCPGSDILQAQVYRENGERIFFGNVDSLSHTAGYFNIHSSGIYLFRIFVEEKAFWINRRVAFVRK